MAKKVKNGIGMKCGLVLGKFMPLHNGHIALIEFAKANCDHLYVLLCYTEFEQIQGIVRRNWLEQFLQGKTGITLIPLLYDENLLPNTSESSKDVSREWAAFITANLPPIDVFFSSEPYGDYLAEFMNIKHIAFDMLREKVPISGFKIREQPFANWQLLPSWVQPYFVKKVALLGSESTGKSLLTKRIAEYFNTACVPEMARDIIEHTEECQPAHLNLIAELHAKTIIQKTKEANKLLICDTDITITKSYSQFLFNQVMTAEDWIEEANRMDLYLFLECDCPYIQDGTRLSEEERNKLSIHHKNFLIKQNIPFISIGGSWDDRYNKACDIIKSNLLAG